MGQNRILIIDNSTIQCQSLSRALAKSGPTVITATKGIDGVNFAVLNQPDVIILDLLMPDLDGFEVCKQLKENPQTQPIHVILFTGRTRTTDIMQGFEVGADMFIGKGLGYDRLVSYVNTVLAKRNGSEANGHSEVTMKMCQELVEWLCAAFEGVVRPRLEIALGTNAAAAVLQQATGGLQAGWKIQALREGAYDHLAVREAVVEFNAFVAEVFRILEEQTSSLEVSHLKDAFEQQLAVFD